MNVMASIKAKPRNFGKLIDLGIKRVCRMVGYTLTLCDFSGMWELAAILCALGIEIETVCESHGGAFPGRHARCVLRSRVERFTGAETAA